MRIRLQVIAFIALQAAVVSAGVPLEVKLLDAKKIWDAAPHNAFTDLVLWNEQFYCAFREGRGHVSADGRIRVLSSKDADAWTSTGLMELAGYDLRDAHLSVTPDNRLMLLGGAAPREGRPERPYRLIRGILQRRQRVEQATNRLGARPMAMVRDLA